MAPVLKLKKLGKQWWILGYKEATGPYDSLEEANEALRGLRRFERNKNEVGYITILDPRLQAERKKQLRGGETLK